MPDEIKKKLCPNCNGELEAGENGLYCAPCDLTFTLAKGRVKVEAGGKGKIQELEETIMILQREQDAIKKDLYGTEQPFWMR